MAGASAASPDTSGWIEAFRVDDRASRGHTPEKRRPSCSHCASATRWTPPSSPISRPTRAVTGPIERCGGKVVGYFAPTKFAGPTNLGLSLIDFPSLAAYERYREALAADPEHAEVARRAAQSGVILVEDRSFVQRAS